MAQYQCGEIDCPRYWPSERPTRPQKARVLAELQQRSKLGNLKPSDEVEGLKFEVCWQPAKGALGVIISPEITDYVLVIVSA